MRTSSRPERAVDAPRLGLDDRVAVVVERDRQSGAVRRGVDDRRRGGIEVEAAVVLEDRAQRLAQLARVVEVRGGGAR